MKPWKIFLVSGLVISLFLLLVACDMADPETETYSLTVYVQGVDSPSHAEHFTVSTEDFGTITFTEDDYEDGVLTSGFDELEGNVKLTLTIDEENISGSYELGANQD